MCRLGIAPLITTILTLSPWKSLRLEINHNFSPWRYLKGLKPVHCRKARENAAGSV